MEERVAQLEKELAELKAVFYKENYEASQIIRKDVTFLGRVGFFTKSGVSQASAIAAPSTPSGTYSSLEAQSAVNAINDIRTALQNIGITA